ncbi:MAG: rhomboid family intramembrane serine protease [Methylocystis sp.]|nr:rhomboid family intramembrane serine protease [Methylocystis sp.]MCA3586129.1 rhomboid family intramembrane serine protease [Methylocystis sp.]MCA3589000.1 rhomboid family intramembrane serine protease [Methylocystis sp.]MCA3592729.1 rhomboid family intramembrane serine protease [Methylocystis sp.]
MSYDNQGLPRSEPAFFAPPLLLFLIGFMLAIHAYRALVLGLFEEADVQLLRLTAFVPARFSVAIDLADLAEVQREVMLASAEFRPLKMALYQTFVADGEAAWWTLVTYAFLHAGWEHAIFNGLWMLAFGSPVMWRVGSLRFLLFFAVTAAAAAAFQAGLNRLDVSILVGASGAVSGLTAAALRFAVGPSGFGTLPDDVFRPLMPLGAAMRDRRVLIFIGIWFGINLLAGLGLPVGGGDGSLRIAWEAHVGGFVAGLLLFPLFDPVRAQV